MRNLSLLLALAASACAQVSLTSLGTPYTQDFNALASSGTSSVVPTGWAFLESGTNANATYTAGTGSGNAGDTYSLGTASTTERAFGGLQSGALIPIVGASFTNNTGGTITSLAISYTGEQWRMGNAIARADRLDFQYSLDATSLATSPGTWVDTDALDFISPIQGGTVGPLDGNAAANRTLRTATITGLSIPPGATFWIRWTDFNATGADDALAVDDFSLTPSGLAGGTPTLSINDVSVNEGNSGTTNAVFTVSLSSPAAAGGVTFDIATAAGTATAGVDYLTNSLTGQVIAAGSSSTTFTVVITGDTEVEGSESYFVNVTNVTGALVSDAQGLGTILNDDFAPVIITQIHDIQGTGVTSPLVGSTVVTEGIVTALTSNGFFLQTPDALIDANPATSQGLFVFTSAAPPAAAAVGNLVRVAGTVLEFRPSADPASRTITQIGTPTVTLLTAGNPLPAAAALTTSLITPAGGPDQLERFEGMRVSAASLTVVAPTDGSVNESSATALTSGVLYAVLTGTPLPFREAGIEVFDFQPGICAAGSGCNVPQFDANPERLRVDSDGIAGQPAINVNTGAVLTNVVGVLHYAFRAYTILPTAAITVGGTPVTVAAAPAPTANAVTVASMNLERLFDTVDDPSVGEVVVTATALNGRLGKMSQAIRNLLQAPDVLALQEVENLATAQLLATRINDDAVAAAQPNPGYSAYLVEGNDLGGIDVAFLVRSSVSVESVTQFGATVTYTNPCTSAQEILNDRPPLRLRAAAIKGGQTLGFVVFVNHLRSLNGVDDTTPCASGTVGGRVRAKRAAQADYVAQLVQSELNANPAARILVVGDLNAFEVNDGYGDSVNAIAGRPAPATQVLTANADPTYPDLTNLLSLLPRAQQYSYVFDGNHQTLDHALMNPAALAQFVGGGYVRVNADFNEANFRGIFGIPERYSDHDPLFVRLTTASNVSAQATFVRAGVIYNRTALTATSSVRITNTTAVPLNGPLSLVITGLPNGVTLTNATSSTSSSAIYSLAGSLAPGQTITVPLTFGLSAIGPITYTAALFSGAL